jgi:crossover junction endodeoxyribonuclease RuvC
MLILGIDPGTAITGWGVVKSQRSEVKSQKLNLVDYGCIVTSKDWEMPQRLNLLQKELKILLQQHKPDVICVEQLFFGINARTAISVAQARGVILATAASLKVPFFEYQGLAVKHKITGSGRADKKMVERGVKRILGIRKMAKPQNGHMDDAVDAVAIAICHVLS